MRLVGPQEPEPIVAIRWRAVIKIVAIILLVTLAWIVFNMLVGSSTHTT